MTEYSLIVQFDYTVFAKDEDMAEAKCRKELCERYGFCEIDIVGIIRPSIDSDSKRMAEK